MMRWAYGIGVALGCLVAACLLPELRGLGSDGSDASPSVDASSNDGSIDGPRADDAGADAARAPCPDSSFCDDFDDGPLGARWSAIEQLDGVFSLEEGGLSAPYRLRMDLLAPKGSARHAGMGKTYAITAGMTRVVCVVSLRIDVRPTASGDDYQILEIAETGGGRTSAYVKVGPTVTQLLEARPNADGGTATTTKSLSTAAGGIPTGAWTKLTLDANYGTKTATLTISIEGGTVTQLSTSLPSGASNKALQLYLGEPDDSDQGLSTTQFDDFRCDFTP